MIQGRVDSLMGILEEQRKENQVNCSIICLYPEDLTFTHQVIFTPNSDPNVEVLRYDM